jgi:hypothetical protein
MAKSKTVQAGNEAVTPITRKEHEKLAVKMRKRQEQLRGTYPEIHGKAVDWVRHSFEDDSLFVSIRFMDKTEFSLQFSPKIRTDGIDLSDMSTGDFELIREYYRNKDE